MDIKIEWIAPKDVKLYENNPRKNDDAVKPVANSIREFGFLVPVVLDKDNYAVAGETRVKAARDELKLPKIPVIRAAHLTDEQIRAFRLADNKVGEIAEWDFDKLTAELEAVNIDMSQFGFELENAEKYLKSLQDEATAGSLSRDFVVPPFSVLDARKGYWQNRKKKWISIGIESEKGRAENLTFASSVKITQSDNGTSIFDPVLCEVIYKWFCVPGGRIFDPFAGGSVRGVMAERLGYSYTGIELRREQVQSNIENANRIGIDCSQIKWHCDDSLNMDKYIGNESSDLVFTCPPYFDLEVYSTDDRDISNMRYEDFTSVYTAILRGAAHKLRGNRFAIVVISDVRDKHGFYRGLLEVTKTAFESEGMFLYNDMILLNVVGSGAYRARNSMVNRKTVRSHQNILVFYKGDPARIKENFAAIEFDEEYLKLMEETLDIPLELV